MILYDLHPEAKIGNNVKISNFTTIYEDVVIGDNTWIGPNVTIFPGARIGKNCKIFPGSVIAAIPQDLKFNGDWRQQCHPRMLHDKPRHLGFWQNGYRRQQPHYGLCAYCPRLRCRQQLRICQ